MEDNETWELTSLPLGKKLIRYKWVYKFKHKATGEIEKHKARLIAKRFTHVEGVNFNGTFAHVTKIITVRCLLIIIATKWWILHQMNVSNAFLHGHLDEKVYMKLPQGFKPTNKDTVCRLKKSLYGLRQASKNWYSKLSELLIDYGFKESKDDHSLFHLFKIIYFLVVLVYINDLIITGNNEEAYAKFKQYLS